MEAIYEGLWSSIYMELGARREDLIFRQQNCCLKIR